MRLTGKSKRRKLYIAELERSTPKEKPLIGFRQARKLSKVLAETRERQKGRLLKSQEEVMSLLRKS